MQIIRRVLRKVFREKYGQINIPTIVVVAILVILLMTFVPVLNTLLSGIGWNIQGATSYLNTEGYTVTDPTGTVYVDDLLPNTDSTYDIGASGTEFAEGWFDNAYVGGSEVVRTSTIVVAASDSTAAGIAQSDYQCDGTADQVQIQAAIDVLPANGGVVQLLEGTYDIAAQVNLSSGCYLRGCGIATILSSSTNTAVLYVGNVANVTIESLKIDGNEAGLIGAAENIWVVNSTDIIIRDVTSIDAKEDGIYVGGDLTNRVLIENITASGCARWALAIAGGSNITVRTADFTDCALGGVDVEPNAIDDILRDITFEDIDTYSHAANKPGFSIYLKVGSTVQYGILLDNIRCYDNDGHGIHIDTVMGLTIINSRFYSNGGSGIYATRDFLDISILNNLLYSNVVNGIGMGMSSETIDSRNILIAGNTIYDHSAGAWTYGIELNVTNNVIRDLTIVNNDVYDNTRAIGFGPLGSLPGLICEQNKFLNSATAWASGSDRVSAPWRRHSDVFTDVLAASANYIVNAQNLTDGAVALTGTQPTYPRGLDCTITEVGGNVTDYTMTVVGINAKGEATTDVFTFGDDGLTFSSDNAFDHVTSVTLADVVDAGNATFVMGIDKRLGLKNVIYETGDVWKIIKNGTKQTVAGAQVDVDYNIYDMSVITLAATDDFEIWYRDNLNTID